MSGDVQPRKRKDKKRKKDDGSEHSATHVQPPIIPNLNEEQNIHVHKEEGTGGGICAKIVFFLLFSALVVCIGLIITEHRGLTDLETAESESRFSQIFEGWIDSSPTHEDDDDHLEHLENQEDDDETHDSHEIDDEHGEEDDEEQQEDELSKEESQQDDEVEEVEDEDEIKSEEEDDDEVDDDRNELQDEDEDNNDVDDGNDDEEEEEEEEEEQENELSEEKETEDDSEQSLEDNEIEDEDNISEQMKSGEDHDDEDDDNDDGIDEEDEEPDKKEVEDSEEKVDKEDEIAEEVDENFDNSRMAVKIGVGLALLVVAYVVLVKKWKSASPAPSDSEDFTTTPDLSRRNTIVVPPTFQQIKQDIEENADEENSEDSGDVGNEDDKTKLKTVKVKYQQLRTTYSRSLTPDDDPNKNYNREEEDVEDEEDDDDDEEDDEEDEEEVEDEGEQEDEEGVEEEEEDDDEEDYENEDYDEDDEELLKRLETKYGKLSDKNTKKEEELDQKFSSWKRVNVRPDNELEESDSDKQSDDVGYDYENVTNKDDWKIRKTIDEAQKVVDTNAAYGAKLFDILLDKYPKSPRCYYGKALALDKLAEQKRSNNLLQQAINTYLKLLNLHDVPDVLFEMAAERCINRMRFIGDSIRAVDVHLKLIDRFPDTLKHRNQLAVSYLTINRPNKAKIVLEETLLKFPNDGFALVHYGFVLKTSNNNLNESVDYMRRGIATKERGVIDGRFYFHLGDALARLGKVDEAMEVYKEGVKHNLFLSKYQRSLYNVNRLTGKPWWDKNDTPYQNLYAQLESNWKIIRDEGLLLLSKTGYFQDESENLKDTGDWKQFELFARGRKNIENCKRCPATCRIIESIPDARDCRRGQTKFSVMHPGTHVWPHCGPTNCRLRVHLGLSVPPMTFIRVADETRSWANGEILIFDDSFEHEVWHNGTELRLVLIVDVWHPELTITEKRSLSPI